MIGFFAPDVDFLHVTSDGLGDIELSSKLAAKVGYGVLRIARSLPKADGGSLVARQRLGCRWTGLN